MLSHVKKLIKGCFLPTKKANHPLQYLTTHLPCFSFCLLAMTFGWVLFGLGALLANFPPIDSGTAGRANICVSIFFLSVTGPHPPQNYNVDSSGGDPRTPALAIVFAQLCVWGKGGRTPSGSLSIAEGCSLTKQDSEEC